MIKAEIIADSKNEFGNRITTMIVTMPRIILAEFNTHRMFSRNSASSRAIPFEKMVKSVEENPFIPIAWQKNHKGMQGSEYVTCRKHENAIYEWLKARDYAVKQARMMNNDGITKQLINRLLEPFMWHTVIITATEWENFFALRCPRYSTEAKINHGIIFRSKKDYCKHYKTDLSFIEENDNMFFFRNNKGQAEIHMMELAEQMWDAMNESAPKELKAGEWHIPFGDNIDLTQLRNKGWASDDDDLKLQIAITRCARVSYTVVGEESKEPNYEKDIKLHDKLEKDRHWSPFEHCAKAMSEEEWVNYINGIQNHRTTGITNDIMGWSGNFRGFIQYRKMFDNENIK
ncbi:MAG: hypothetical protein EKK61_03750 [Rickettsiales bacterium]|nr:MAG: hypothetical protein EKK61_03750 [Rickettsiales bacterium]